jgi:mRNA interferase MazF
LGAFARGDVVTVPFPYSGAPGEKLRPVLVLTSWMVGQMEDCLVCMITSQRVLGDPHLIPLQPEDVAGGALRAVSYLRPAYVYAVERSRIRRKVGELSPPMTRLALQRLIQILQ